MTESVVRTRPLYRELASVLLAIENCRRAGNNEWLDNHETTLKELADMLPSGSGIDCGTVLERDECTASKLVLICEFHHMNDAGMYDGWTTHKIVVTPLFDGIDMKIGGRDRNDIKDYLADTYHHALTQDVEI